MKPPVLITGATRGIGRSCALSLARAGFDLVLWARNRPELERVAEECEMHRARVVVAQVDVRDSESVRGAGARSLAEFEALRGLVVNAGIGEWRRFMEVEPREWNDIIGTNLTGAYHCLQVAVPLLRQAAQIVAIGSDSSHFPFADRAAYCASKWGLRGLLESLRLELRPRGVRLTHLMVGRVDTYFRHRQPGQRPNALQADDVAALVATVFALPAHCELRELEAAALNGSFGPYAEGSMVKEG